MADVYDFRESAKKLGRNPGFEPPPDAEAAPVVAMQPPAVFSRVLSTAMGACKTLVEVKVIARAQEPPDVDI